MTVFPGSVIRKLTRSEEVFAVNETYFAFTARVNGPVDLDAMSDAFDALLESHPVFTGRLEKADDGRYQIGSGWSTKMPIRKPRRRPRACTWTRIKPC
jgi:hypothetical protein